MTVSIFLFFSFLSSFIVGNSSHICHISISDQILCESAEEESKPVVNFVLMTRCGNKQQYNSVEMPVNSELVTKLRTREEVRL